MDVTVNAFDGSLHVIEVGVDDTTAGFWRKVASAVGFSEHNFRRSFTCEMLDEGADVTQLSAGDTIVLKRAGKHEAVAELHARGWKTLTTETLARVEDAKVVCLFLQADVAMPGFLLKENPVVRLDLSAPSGVTVIRRYFLYNCASLESVDLSGMSCVTHVEDVCLVSCVSLTTLNLSSWSGVTSIGSSFVAGCKRLETLDLSPLTGLVHIGNGFLAGCELLKELDLPPHMDNLMSIGERSHFGSGFLEDCKSLRQLVLPPMNSLLSIWSSFLRG